MISKHLPNLFVSFIAFMFALWVALVVHVGFQWSNIHAVQSKTPGSILHIELKR